jgi:uncharacterized protein YceK
MARQAILLLWAILMIVPANGCGSFLNQGLAPGGNNSSAHRLYGGVRTDLHLLGDAVVDPVTNAVAGRPTEAGRGAIVLPFALAFCAVDLPMSAAVDTATLPLDLLHSFDDFKRNCRIDLFRSDDDKDSAGGTERTVREGETSGGVRARDGRRKEQAD